MEHVMLDEPAAVARRAATGAERILERCQGADPARELDQRAPGRGRHVRPRHRWPSEYEESTEHDEGDKRGVNDEDGIGKHSITHTTVESSRQLATPASESLSTGRNLPARSFLSLARKYSMPCGRRVFQSLAHSVLE